MEGLTVRKIINIILIMALLALGVLLTIGAETGKTNRTSRNIDIELSKEEIPKLIEIIKIWKFVDELELKEEQLVEFLPRFKNLDDLRIGYYTDKRKAVNDLKKLLETDASNDQLKSAEGDLRKAEIEYRQKERQLADALNSGLTIKQQAKLVVFQDGYRRDMHNLVRKLRELSELKEQRQNLKPQPVPLKEKK
jgi:hypothetical protein